MDDFTLWVGRFVIIVSVLFCLALFSGYVFNYIWSKVRDGKSLAEIARKLRTNK